MTTVGPGPLEDACACDTGLGYLACCGRYHAGAAAPTALALMRSRYTAYARGHHDYLIATHDPATRGPLDREQLAAASAALTWIGLTIVAVVDGGLADHTGVVEFEARARRGAQLVTQRERSRFRRLDGRWCYVDGAIGRTPAQATAAPGRNDPCPCGSGQKYKRCHGR